MAYGEGMKTFWYGIEVETTGHPTTLAVGDGVLAKGSPSIVTSYAIEAENVLMAVGRALSYTDDEVRRIEIWIGESREEVEALLNLC